MKTAMRFLLACVLMAGLSACGKDNCKRCTGCKTKADARLCEKDFEKTSDYYDKIDDMVSDSCTCVDD